MDQCFTKYHFLLIALGFLTLLDVIAVYTGQEAIQFAAVLSATITIIGYGIKNLNGKGLCWGKES